MVANALPRDVLENVDSSTKSLYLFYEKVKAGRVILNLDDPRHISAFNELCEKARSYKEKEMISQTGFARWTVMVNRTFLGLIVIQLLKHSVTNGRR